MTLLTLIRDQSGLAGCAGFDQHLDMPGVEQIKAAGGEANPKALLAPYTASSDVGTRDASDAVNRILPDPRATMSRTNNLATATTDATCACS